MSGKTKRKDERRKPPPYGNVLVWRASRVLGWTLFNATFGLRFLGTHNIPRQGAFIIVANHCSFLDPIFMSVPVNRPITYLTASEYTGRLFPGLLMKPYGVISVPENVPSVRLYAMSLEILRSGRPIGIFPEGTRSYDGRLREFQPGMARLATATGAPILPTTIVGTFQAWPRTRLLPDFKPVTVIYHPLIKTRPAAGMTRAQARQYEIELTRQVREAIASGFGMVKRTVRAWEPV